MQIKDSCHVADASLNCYSIQGGMFVFFEKDAPESEIQRTGILMACSIRSNMEKGVYLAAHPGIVKLYFASSELTSDGDVPIDLIEEGTAANRGFPYILVYVVLAAFGGAVAIILCQR